MYVACFQTNPKGVVGVEEDEIFRFDRLCACSSCSLPDLGAFLVFAPVVCLMDRYVNSLVVTS